MVGVTERAEVKPGAGEETFDKRGPVLHPFEPGRATDAQARRPSSEHPGYRIPVAGHSGACRRHGSRMSRPVAFVTGGAGGIGRATVRELARRGYAVAISDLGHADDAAALASEVQGIASDVDVADPVAIAQAIRDAEEQLGPIDVAICCAGFDVDQVLDLTDDYLWARFLHVLLGGCVNVIAAVRPSMRDRATGSI